ncbi:MAG TPA: hypothetical protein VFD37_00490, partial [Solirubrobacterales bacterium]|nr:hypothetical protein [Solirubrobacterales bacterium]
GTDGTAPGGDSTISDGTAPGGDSAPAAAARQTAGRSRAGRPADPGAERPPAPWGSLPLAEILVVAGIVFLIWGLIAQNAVILMVGLALASLGGLELSVREHFGGYRSHTVLLAGVAGAAATAAGAIVTPLAPAFCLAIGAVIFLACFFALRRVFRRASGGFTYRIGGFKA